MTMSPSYMNMLHGRVRPAMQHRKWQWFWPNYALPPVAQHAMAPTGAPPALVAGTNIPNMPLGQVPGIPTLTPAQMEQAWKAMEQALDTVPPELQSKIAKKGVDAAWPHLAPKVKEIANEAADTASLRAVAMAGGVALVVLLTSYWIKKG
jgi:hypothetical protein